MTISFEIPTDAQRMLHELREWSLQEVRPLARIADREQTKFFAEGQRVIESCPLDISPLSIPEYGMVNKYTGKRFRASNADEDNHVLGVLAMEAMCYGDGWVRGALPRHANL